MASRLAAPRRAGSPTGAAAPRSGSSRFADSTLGARHQDGQVVPPSALTGDRPPAGRSARPQAMVFWNSAPLVVPRRRHGRRLAERSRSRPAKRPPGHRPGVRRAHRQAALDVPADSAAGESGNETWENDSWAYTGAANVWSLISADEELGYVYLPLDERRPTTCTAATGSATTCSATASSASKCATGEARLALPDRPPRSVGLRHRRPRRFSPTSRSTAGRSRRSCSSRSRRSRTCSIA